MHCSCLFAGDCWCSIRQAITAPLWSYRCCTARRPFPGCHNLWRVNRVSIMIVLHQGHYTPISLHVPYQ